MTSEQEAAAAGCKSFLSSVIHAARATPILALASLSIPAEAGTLKVLHSFTGAADGGVAVSSITLDSAGNIYGEAAAGANACGAPGGAVSPGNAGCGTVYKIDPSGTLTTLVTFLGATNGAFGQGNMTLNGTTLFGSAYSSGPNGDGLIFQIGTDGTNFQVLHAFNFADGDEPYEYPRITVGNTLYDTTQIGGSFGSGTLVAVRPDGTETVLHNFNNYVDGGGAGRILVGKNGVIFGTCLYGGPVDHGTFWSYDPRTGVFSLIRSFKSEIDGNEPQISAIDSHGTIYGASKDSGGYGKYGVLFAFKQVAAGYSERILYTFTGGADGGLPQGGPVISPSGTLIGTTNSYGSGNGGTIFSYASGTLTTLYAFSTASGPFNPQASPTVAPSGTIYGTTAYGGDQKCMLNGMGRNGCGAVYSFTP